MNTTTTETLSDMTKGNLVEYVRVARGSRKGHLQGVVVATDKGIGWSRVNTKPHVVYDKKKRVNIRVAGDTFDKARGLQIALDRINSGTNSKVPHDVQPVMARMAIRAAKYFKNAALAISIVPRAD